MKALALLLTFVNMMAFDLQKDIFGKVRDVEEKYLNPLTQDLSILLNSSNFYDATKLKLPGFDLSMRTGLIKVSDKNKLLKDEKIDYIPLPLIVVEVGLPLQIDMLMKGLQVYNITIFGGGIKYKLFDLKFLKFLELSTLSASFSYTGVWHRLFSFRSFNPSVLASFKIPLIPVSLNASIGYEFSRLEVGDYKGEYNAPRANIGASIYPFPLFYLHFSIGYTQPQIFYNINFGVRYGGII